MRGCGFSASLAALAALFATGCLGSGGGNGGDVRRSAETEAVIASIQQYPGARLVDRHDGEAASELQYELPTSVEGSQVQLHFRRLLATRRWRCSFNERAADVHYGFRCLRDGQALDGEIGDRGGYTLVVHG